MSLSTRPLTPNFGLEIFDVDLRQPTDDMIAEIDALWVKHPVLLVRNQLLDEVQQIAFSKRFGEINIHVRTDIRSRSHPEVVMVSNLRLENGDNIGALASGEAKWHTDSCYKSKPDTGSLLYALEVPDDGGKTAWANLQLAYEVLPDATKTKLAGKRGQYAYNIFNVDITKDDDVKDIALMLYDSALVSAGFDIDDQTNFQLRMLKNIKGGLNVADDAQNEEPEDEPEEEEEEKKEEKKDDDSAEEKKEEL